MRPHSSRTRLVSTPHPGRAQVLNLYRSATHPSSFVVHSSFSFDHRFCLAFGLGYLAWETTGRLDNDEEIHPNRNPRLLRSDSSAATAKLLNVVDSL